MIGVPAHFNNLQRDATIKAAEKAGFEEIELINEPTAAAIAYGDIIKSNKERNVLIFDLGVRTFDVSIVKIKGNEYNVLASLGEGNLGGENFNQRLMKYVMGKIKKDNRFKDINFEDKNNDKMKKILNKLIKKIEELKITLSCEDNGILFYEYLNGNDDLDLEITRSKYEELCMDLWKKCLIKVDEAVKKAKLKKEKIDEIILVGGSSRTPKIKEMVKNYFNKEPFQNINSDEIVAYGLILQTSKKLNIHDISTKAIGIKIGSKMYNIIPQGEILPISKNKILKFNKDFIKNNMNDNLTIKVYEISNNMSFNEYLGEIPIKFDNDSKENEIKIKIHLNNNSIEVSAIIKDKNNNEIEIKMTQGEQIIGIDIGTSYSSISIMKNDKIEILEDNLKGDKRIPSIICFKKDKFLIGTLAKNNMITYCESVIFGNKRLIGIDSSNKNLEDYIKNSYIKINTEKNKPKYIINNEKKSPKDIHIEIFKYLKQFVEPYYNNNEIKKTIITVPNYFNEIQKNETKEAAENAGFKVIKIIEESIAAAIGYENIIKSKKERIILIFDLGGGNLNISIVQLNDNEFNVLSSLGEENLGGENFNQRLFDYVIKEINKDNRFKHFNFNNKEDKKIIRALLNIKKEIENLKIKFSSESEEEEKFKIDLENNDFEIEIKRNKYEELCMDLWEKCLKILDEAVKKAKLEKNKIDEIILVGGSTRIPKIKQMIKNYFNGKEPLQNINAEEIVVFGTPLAFNKNNI